MSCRRLVVVAGLLGYLYSSTALHAEDAKMAEKAQRLLSNPLAVRVQKDNEDCSARTMLCGQVIEANLTTRDCKLSNGTYGATWFFPSYHSQAIGVAASSPDFTLLAGLADPNRTVLAAGLAQPNQITSFGAFTDIPGNYEIALFSDPSSVAKVGSYLFAVACDVSCVSDVASLCLLDKRFRVQVAWRNQFDGTQGFGRALPQTDFTGFFSFGDPANIELLIKVLDFGGTFKVFYGELTNLQFSLAVTDMISGNTKTYNNTPGDCGGIDQQAFPSRSGAAELTGKAAKVGCRTSRNSLCLLNRFTVTVDWRNPGDGTSGTGSAVSLSNFNGSFSFTDPKNVELVIKMLDFGDRIAVFYGALSDLEYTIKVTDTSTGVVKTYSNPAHKFCGGLDNSAF